MSLILSYAARTDLGLVRANNEDAFHAGPRVLAIADGMGGHAAGEVAARLVITALASLDERDPGEDLLSELRTAVRAGNAAIAEATARCPNLAGMGTTLTAILIAGDRIGVANIGDSRTYLMRDNVCTQITHDDSLVQSYLDLGRITPEEARTHRQRALVLRALTGHAEEPSLFARDVRAGDRYLLCSDGLSDVVSHGTLSETLRMPDPRGCADQLVKLALDGGGPDNVTVIVADALTVGDEPTGAFGVPVPRESETRH